MPIFVGDVSKTGSYLECRNERFVLGLQNVHPGFRVAGWTGWKAEYIFREEEILTFEIFLLAGCWERIPLGAFKRYQPHCIVGVILGQRRCINSGFRLCFLEGASKIEATVVGVRFCVGSGCTCTPPIMNASVMICLRTSAGSERYRKGC